MPGLDPPESLYSTTAPRPTAAPELAADDRAEILVIGGGYTGLWAALHLAERGREVVLLEAREPGFGAAGRNGGQVNAGLKYDPDVAERALGPLYGPRLVRAALGAPEFLFGLIERLAIDCEASRSGTLRLARSARHLAAIGESVQQWRSRGIPVERWSGAEVASATGTAGYLGGMFDPGGGSLNPLALARGLARAAIRGGARIHAGSPVVRLEREGKRWLARTPRAALRAEKVLIATDGYSDELWPGLRQSLVPIFSSIIATEPLPADLAAAVLPGRQVVYESGNITVYYRLDAANRLLMGGRGKQREAPRRGDYRHLTSYARKLWPALERIEWTHWWNGQFALTADFYPRFHIPEPGVFIMLGYSGRGLALSSVMGSELASILAGAPVESFLLPVSPIRSLPLHRFWRLGVQAGVLRGRVLDALGR
jgi:glycine/D-amino acid oxidase-like deaminating enzyme